MTFRHSTIRRIKFTLTQEHCRVKAIRVALCVGTLLFTINHGSAVMNGEMSTVRWVSFYGEHSWAEQSASANVTLAGL